MAGSLVKSQFWEWKSIFQMKSFFIVVTFIVWVKLYFEVSNLDKHFPSSEVRWKDKKNDYYSKELASFYSVGRKLEEPAWQQEKMACYGIDVNWKITKRTLTGSCVELIKTKRGTLF